MGSSAKIQETLLNKIIKLTDQIIDAMKSNHIRDASVFVEQRAQCLELLSSIKTSDVCELPNYQCFINSLVKFNRQMHICA